MTPEQRAELAEKVDKAAEVMLNVAKKVAGFAVTVSAFAAAIRREERK